MYGIFWICPIPTQSVDKTSNLFWVLDAIGFPTKYEQMERFTFLFKGN